MPLPTRTKSTKLPQRADQTKGNGSHVSKTVSAPSQPDTSPTFDTDGSITVTKKTTASVRRAIPKTTIDTSSTSGNTRLESKVTDKPENTTSKTTTQSSINEPNTRASSTQLRSQQPSHSRNLSTTAVSSRIPPKSHQRAQSTLVHRPVNKSDAAIKPQKPAFNTFQQHYSPVKPNPRSRDISGSLAKQAETKPAESDNSSIHDELLQLQILHRESIPILQQYETSVKEHIRGLKVRLEQSEASLMQKKQEYAKVVSLSSLNVWLEGEPLPTGQNTIQLLSRTLEDITVLTTTYDDPDGPFFKFVSWNEQVRKRRHDRKFNSKSEAALLSVSHLGLGWKEEMTSIADKAGKFKSALKSFRIPQQDNSGLYAVFHRHLVLIEVIHRSAQMALTIEEEIVSSEREWMMKEVEEALVEYGNERSRINGHIPAWHMDR